MAYVLALAVLGFMILAFCFGALWGLEAGEDDLDSDI